MTKTLVIQTSPVKSGQVAEIGYDEATNTMAVKFRQGNGVYHYHGVDPGTYNAFKSAESHGKYLHQHIKGKFAFTKIEH